MLSKKIIYKAAGKKGVKTWLFLSIFLIPLITQGIFGLGEELSVCAIFLVIGPWAIIAFAVDHDSDYQGFRCEDGEHTTPTKFSLKLERNEKGAYVSGICSSCGERFIVKRIEEKEKENVQQGNSNKTEELSN